MPAERRQVEKVICVEEQIETPLVHRIRVIDAIAVLKEDAEAGQLTFRKPDFACLQQRRRARVIILRAAFGDVDTNLEV